MDLQDVESQNHLIKNVAKIVAAGGVIWLLYTYTPLVECLFLFVMVVMVPLMLMASVGLISTSLMKIIAGGPGNFREKVEEAAESYRKGYRDTATA